MFSSHSTHQVWVYFARGAVSRPLWSSLVHWVWVMGLHCVSYSNPQGTCGQLLFTYPESDSGVFVWPPSNLERMLLLLVSAYVWAISALTGQSGDISVNVSSKPSMRKWSTLTTEVKVILHCMTVRVLLLQQCKSVCDVWVWAHNLGRCSILCCYSNLVANADLP